MKINRTILVLLFSVGLSASLEAHKPKKHKKPNKPHGITSSSELNLRTNCANTTSQIDLKINNIQARLQVGGDLWWDRTDGKYIVPKVIPGSGQEEVSSLYAGGVWLGGYDPDGNLKLAASTYGLGGYDYYAGPLDDNTGLTEASTCNAWDIFFTVTGEEVKRTIRGFDNAINNGEHFDLESIDLNVKTWPGQGNPHFESRYGFSLPDTQAGLGSFWDENGDGVYRAEQGDFPIIDIRGCEPSTRKAAAELVPDEIVFWIFNDAGNTHNESDADAIRMEVQVQAFSYATNDAVNDMTFYRYKLINRASEDIRDTYFAMWVDPDLGCHTDDYSGCDISRNLVYTYNADELDGGSGCDLDVASYGSNVPMIGIDLLKGPIATKKICSSPNELGCVQHIVKNSDLIDGFSSLEIGDTIYIREPNFQIGEEGDISIELGMTSCMIYNSGDIANTTDPVTPEQYYGYMKGQWLDGEPLTRGGSGYNPSAPEEAITKFAFSDPPNLSDGWSMWQERLGANDRRTVQASGPFMLKPGAISELIVGAIWVPDVVHPGPSLEKITAADDIAQSLFDECFNIADGPDAPSITTIELDQEIILVLHNDSLKSNNAFLGYEEIDIFATPEDSELPNFQRTYVFEGYKVFQLSDPSVSAQQLNDISKARIVAQVDLENNVTDLYNWTSIPNPIESSSLENLVWTPELKVTGANKGIQNTFSITTDQFSSENPKLVNHKQYYYMAVAYAYNEFQRFDPDLPYTTQPRPYLEGRGNVKTYIATPRPIVYEELNAAYGDGAEITRLHGVGVGGNILELKDEMYDKILSGTFDGRLEYREGAGPITVKVYNPLEVQNGKFQLEIIGEHSSEDNCSIVDGAGWKVTHIESGKEFFSETSIDELNEQLIAEYGFSIAVKQTNLLGSNTDSNNGALGSEVSYDYEEAVPWFRGITDGLQDVETEDIGFGRNLFDFIKTENPEPDPEAYRADPNSRFQALGSRYWYPFPLVSSEPETNGLPYVTPGSFCTNSQGNLRPNGNILKNMNNVDIVMTPDKSKWSRCIVVETANQFYDQENCEMLNIKLQPSKGPDGELDNDINGTGMSYFPGYAIDVETGKRLNIFFGENSYYNQDFADKINADPDRPQGDGNGLEIGDDMLYNPSDRFFQGATDFSGIDAERFDNLFMGGHHYVYVTRQEYDGCAQIREAYNENSPFLSLINMYQSVTWCSMTMCQEGQNLLPYSDVVIPAEVSFSLRVERPYNIETTFNVNASCIPADESKLPLYEFEIKEKETNELVEENFSNALDNIMAVPNPYYAYSSYESSASDNTIKITNLPARAVVTVYSLDGLFIKQFDRDETTIPIEGANPGVSNSQIFPDLDWDLKNSAGTPISSGVYLIHVTAPDLGLEKTIKWFGVNRQFDP